MGVGLVLGALLGSLLSLPPVRAATLDSPAEAMPGLPAPASTVSVALTPDAASMHQWVLATRDHAQRPFVIVDKKSARVFVYDAQGRLLGAAHTLLGQAAGDHSVPGVGNGDVNLIPVAHRTTPAGRFDSEPGRNLSGESIVWVDYDAALAIHRVRPGRAYNARLQALSTATPADNRASLGCVVVLPAFYDAVIAPTLGRQRGVVYVLPEQRTLAEVFGTRLAGR